MLEKRKHGWMQQHPQVTVDSAHHWCSSVHWSQHQQIKTPWSQSNARLACCILMDQFNSTDPAVQRTSRLHESTWRLHEGLIVTRCALAGGLDPVSQERSLLLLDFSAAKENTKDVDSLPPAAQIQSGVIVNIIFVHDNDVECVFPDCNTCWINIAF